MKITLPKYTISNINAIFILDCLGNDELQTGRNCEEQIIDLLPPGIGKKKNRVYRERCLDLSSFYNFMKKISDLCKQEAAPLIHIHGHGNKNEGLQLTDGFVSWYDLMEKLREITINANGETTIIASFCYSYQIVNAFLNKCKNQDHEILRVPFGFFYGYRNEISAGVVEQESKCINKSILQNGGQGIMDNPPKNITQYSEYNYIDEQIAYCLYLVNQKTPNSMKIDNFSLGNIRENILRKGRERGIPFDYSRKYFNSLRDNPKPLLKNIIEYVMYDTERKLKYLEAIDKITVN